MTKRAADSKFPLVPPQAGLLAFHQRFGYALLVGGWDRRAGGLYAGGFTLQLAWVSSYLLPYTLCQGRCAHFGLLPSGFRLWTTDPRYPDKSKRGHIQVGQREPGAFNQAFTHLALISAAVNLDRMLGSQV